MALAWARLGVGSGCGGGVVTSPDASDSRLAFTSESAKSTTPHQQDTVPQVCLPADDGWWGQHRGNIHVGTRRAGATGRTQRRACTVP
jgi:hypothetical protein